MYYFIILSCVIFALFNNAKAQTINQMFRDQYSNPGSGGTKSTVPLKKAETNNQSSDAVKLFLSNKIYYYGLFNCGKRVDVVDTDPGYSNNIAGEFIGGKTTITTSWGGKDPGSRTLNWSIDNNGNMSIKGSEKSLSGRVTTYKMSGILDIKNIQLELNGTKSDSNNTVLRKCYIQVSLMETPENFGKKVNPNSNVSNIINQNLTEEQREEISVKQQAEKELAREAEIENKRLREEAESKAKIAETSRIAAIEVEKQKQREVAEAKLKSDREAELVRIAAIEIEKQKQKAEADALSKAQSDAIAARVAALEIEKKKQKDAEIERLTNLEIEKKKAREQLEEKAKADALRVAALEAENQRQKEEADAKSKAQRLVDLENELKKLRGETTQPKPAVQSRQDVAKNENDPLYVFEGTWVSVNPPVFYLIFNKVALGIRQVSLPNIGQGNIRLSDGSHGSNFQISATNLNCFYFVTFTNNRQKMVMELKAGENLCLQSSILEKAE